VSNVTRMVAMFYAAYSFNQDLSFWEVDNVSGETDGISNCAEFSIDTTAWTLPKPNFTNCDPN